MNLQQLRYLCAIVHAEFNLSHAAKTLNTSQPGVSRYVQLLEAELGVKLLIRDKKRITGLTPAGNAIAEAANHVVRHAVNIRSIAKDYQQNVVRKLTVATSDNHARYTLPAVIERFVKMNPSIAINLRQGSLKQIENWVRNGEADLYIANPAEPILDFSLLRCHELHRIVLTPVGHPLLSKEKVGLEDLARYPIMTRHQVVGDFHARGLAPQIALTAIDADLMKSYVEAGLGIAIVSHTVFNRRIDRKLRAIDARHLFAPKIVYVGAPRHTYLSKHAIQFIQLFAPHLGLDQIERTFRYDPLIPR